MAKKQVRVVVIAVGAAVLSGLLWFSEIPQGIWLARTVYHANTINGKIEAVKKENERLQQQIKDDAAKAAAAGS